MNPNTQFSFRETLAVFLFVGLGLASLRIGGFVVSVTVSLAIVLGMYLAIIAFVGRGQDQAFAIGFLLPVIIYAAATLAGGQGEFHVGSGWLLTSQFLSLVNKVIIEPNGWMRTDHSFSPSTYMGFGHVLIALMFGYAGARFAVALHWNQQDAQRNKDDKMT